MSSFNENVLFHQLDVTNKTGIGRVLKFVVLEFGHLDILVNNAGINYDTWHQAQNADLDNVYKTFETNFIGPWRIAQSFIPLMKKQRYGRIVNVSSGVGALKGMAGGTPGYGLSKTA